MTISTELHAAATTGDVSRVRALITESSDPDVQEQALMWAAEWGQVALVDYLLSIGVDANTQVHGITALHLAASSRELEVVRLLLARGADPNACDARGVPVLSLAVDAIMPWNHEEGPHDSPSLALIETLLQAGADPNQPGIEGPPLAIGSRIVRPPAKLTRLMQQYGATIADDVIELVAIEELARSGDPHALPRLIALLETGSTDAIRNAAALGLRDLRNPAAVPALLKQIAEPRNEHRVGILLHALEPFDAREAAVDLAHLMCRVSYATKLAVVRVFEAYGGPPEPAVGETALRVLRACVPGQDKWAREAISRVMHVLEGRDPL